MLNVSAMVKHVIFFHGGGSEVNRVLKKDAHFLFSFQVGEETLHFDKTNGIDVDIDLHLFQTNRILKLLRDNKFRIIDTVERLHYPDVEYATKRAYVWAEKFDVDRKR